MKSPVEVSIDLSAEELLAADPAPNLVEVEDVCEIDPALWTDECESGMNAAAAPASTPAEEADDSVELELTAEQMDALFEAHSIPDGPYKTTG